MTPCRHHGNYQTDRKLSKQPANSHLLVTSILHWERPKEAGSARKARLSHSSRAWSKTLYGDKSFHSCLVSNMVAWRSQRTWAGSQGETNFVLYALIMSVTQTSTIANSKPCIVAHIKDNSKQDVPNFIRLPSFSFSVHICARMLIETQDRMSMLLLVQASVIPARVTDVAPFPSSKLKIQMKTSLWVAHAFQCQQFHAPGQDMHYIAINDCVTKFNSRKLHTGMYQCTLNVVREVLLMSQYQVVCTNG